MLFHICFSNISQLMDFCFVFYLKSNSFFHFLFSHLYFIDFILCKTYLEYWPCWIWPLLVPYIFAISLFYSMSSEIFWMSSLRSSAVSIQLCNILLDIFHIAVLEVCPLTLGFYLFYRSNILSSQIPIIFNYFKIPQPV